ncbi:MAG: amino acid permease, partial [Rhodanobacter sp.]
MHLPRPAISYLRSMRPWDAALVVVGGVIGGGIFLNPGIVAQRTESGLAVLLLWVGAGLLTLAGVLCYAELGARRPHAGGTYVYLREAFGPLSGFLFGWTMLLVIYSGSAAAVATIFASYVVALAGLPPSWALPLTIGGLVFVSGINLFGIRLGAQIQNVFALLKLLAVAVLVVCGLFL